jgi:hypothetical protein
LAKEEENLHARRRGEECAAGKEVELLEDDQYLQVRLSSDAAANPTNSATLKVSTWVREYISS